MYQRPNKNLVIAVGLIVMSWFVKNRLVKWMVKQGGYLMLTVWGLREERGGTNNFRRTMGMIVRLLSSRK